MTETEVHNLFPTPLWIVDYAPDIHQPLNAQLVGTLSRMLDPRPEIPLGGTLQTDNDLQTFDEFADLVALAAEAVQGALRHLQIVCENFEFTGFWANINPPGGINTPHTHPNNFLSGVYYAQTDEGADSIYFHDPRPQAMVVSPPVESETIYSGNEAVVPARAGRMIVFPAWLSHGVPPNRSARDRISFSFNVMFPDYTETMSRPKWEPSARLRRGGSRSA